MRMSYHVCQRCERFVSRALLARMAEMAVSDMDTMKSKNDNDNKDDHDNNNNEGSNDKDGKDATETCVICLGLWQRNDKEDSFGECLTRALQTALQPYSSSSSYNYFSRRASPPSVHLPGEIVHRFRAVLQSRGSSSDSTILKTTTSTTKTTDSDSFTKKATIDLVQGLKEFTKQTLQDCCTQMEQVMNTTAVATATTTEEEEEITHQQPPRDDQDLGALAVHVIVTPSLHIPIAHCNRQHPKQQRQRRGHKRPTMDGITTQGGDPRRNLELRIVQQQPPQQQSFGTQSLVSIQQVLEQTYQDDDNTATHLLQPLLGTAYNVHVAVWRRPFYVRSEYTKTRRDVPQTPFFVQDNDNVVNSNDDDNASSPNKRQRRLGNSSVEEEILPVLIKYCGGISTQNNDPTTETTLFGKAKFHASGREDMDVRMLLPSKQQHDGDSIKEESYTITGRPFVCEVTDAHRLPTAKDLLQIVREINHMLCPDNTDDNDHKDSKESMLAEDQQSYGRNPSGVGIAPGLKYVESAAFKNLQADTENKVKHYGCLCWSKDPLPPTDKELRAKLGSFPLALEQRTPIRVVHRRPNMIRHRNVLTCQVRRLDDHYFRLYISTDAGTYVKEFVHGDLGRTKPSVASIFGCKVDILELDCEGIQC